MNIAYINADPEVPVFGTTGCSVHVQEMLRAMIHRGASVDLFTSRFGDAVTAEFSSVRAHQLPAMPKQNGGAREKAALATNAPLHNMLAEQHRKTPFSFIYERQSLWSFSAMEFAREENLPALLEVNAPLIEERASSRALIDRSSAEEVTMRAFRAATAITVVSQELGHLVATHPSARGKVHVVPNGVNVERFASAIPTLSRSADEFIVGFIGTLKPWQGLTTLVDAFELFVDAWPPARLIIVGDGPEREHLDREIAAREIVDRVTFIGAVPPGQIPGLLASMDAALAPYAALANFYFSPLKLYEYMAAGLPVVASRIGQIQEVIADGVTGRLVSPGNAEAFAEALYELASNPDLRRQLGTAAHHAVARSHTWDSVLDRVLALVRNDESTAAMHMR